MRYIFSFLLGFQMALITLKLIGETSLLWGYVFVPLILSVITSIIIFILTIYKMGQMIAIVEELNNEALEVYFPEKQEGEKK